MNSRTIILYDVSPSFEPSVRADNFFSFLLISPITQKNATASDAKLSFYSDFCYLTISINNFHLDRSKLSMLESSRLTHVTYFRKNNLDATNNLDEATIYSRCVLQHNHEFPIRIETEFRSLFEIYDDCRIIHE